MQERTYSDLLTLIRSLAGAGGFTAEEQTSILSFVNRRASEAYNMSQSWPRYLVVGEERAIDSSPASTIPYAEAGKNTIYEWIRIHRTQPFLRQSALEFNFYVDSNGAHILNLTTADATNLPLSHTRRSFHSLLRTARIFLVNGLHLWHTPHMPTSFGWMGSMIRL
jgi:hypothetical protein